MMMTMAMDVSSAASHGGMDDEKKCLLTPTSLSDSCSFLPSHSGTEMDRLREATSASSSTAAVAGLRLQSDAAGAVVPPAIATTSTAGGGGNFNFFSAPPLIYSEPALLNLVNSAAYTNMITSAYSEAALANIYMDQISVTTSDVPPPDTVVHADNDDDAMTEQNELFEDLDDEALDDDDEDELSAVDDYDIGAGELDDLETTSNATGSAAPPCDPDGAAHRRRPRGGREASGHGETRRHRQSDGQKPPGHRPIIKILSRGFTPKSSFYFTESQPSVSTTVVGGSSTIPHKQSFSTREIREQHMEIQKKYRPSRKRHYTDPVDFEGILNIIGGCSWWQIWVYLLISLQQIPHAMFNLSVVYMMYQPDHWCQVPGMNATHGGSGNSTTPYLWTNRDTMATSIVYPKTKNKQRDVLDFHSQCHFYDRGAERYDELRQMSLEDAQKSVSNENRSAPIVKCQQWEFDQDVMKKTIVTEWNLVCDDNFKRAHAHLFYSFGFLFGCLLGGFASDRFGRKPTVIGFGILSSMFGLILPYSTYFPMFLFIRFCGAVCNEAADLAAYVLCMEITGTRYRAMVGSLLQAPWAVGYATLALIAYFCKSWQYIQLITAALHTITICLICVLPESPRWLIVNNRVEEAERYIRRACREPPFPFNLCNFNKCSLPCDLELVKHAEQRKWVRRGQKANILHLLKSRALCVRTAIICIVWIATALVYYGLVIALSDQSAPGRVLFSGNFFVNNAIAGAIELPTLLICVYLMKYGRKRSQMFTLMGAAIFIFAAMAAINSKSPMVLALALMLMGKIFIQGAFNILYIFTSEMYPTVIRNSAVGFCSMIARFGSGVSSYIAILSDVTLAIVPMIIFATFSLFAGMLVMLLPETRDQPLPDTLQDAVTFLKSDHRYECYGFGGGGGKQGGVGLFSTRRGGGAATNESGDARPPASASMLNGAGNELVDEKCADEASAPASSNATSDADVADASGAAQKRSENFNEPTANVPLPVIPEAPHDAEIQGTWSAALTCTDRITSKISAAALFEEMIGGGESSLASESAAIIDTAVDTGDNRNDTVGKSTGGETKQLIEKSSTPAREAEAGISLIVLKAPETTAESADR